MSDMPATSEVLLKSDASRQFLDSLLGQGWDAWGQGLGGSQGAELMLEMFSAFNIVALASISALFLWVLAVRWRARRMRVSPSAKSTVRCGCPCVLWGQWARWLPFSRD